MSGLLGNPRNSKPWIQTSGMAHQKTKYSTWECSYENGLKLFILIKPLEYT